MKRILSVGLLALCALTLAEHQAHAWVNSRFSIGMNWHHQSGNTSYLWGLWRNGQVPGPEAFGGGGGPPGGPGGYYQMPPQSHPFPFFGQTGPGGAQPNNAGPQSYPASTPTPLPIPADPSTQKVAQQQMYNPYYNPYYTSPYQMVGYQYGVYPPPSAYYHPYYQPTYQPSQSAEAPFYWYHNSSR